MKKVWDFLLLVVSGLLVFVAIIAVAIGLSREDEPPATADSRGESTRCKGAQFLPWLLLL